MHTSSEKSPLLSADTREVAALDLSEVSTVLLTDTADTKVRSQKNDQFLLAQVAHIVPLPLWADAYSVLLFSGWMWLRKWIAGHRDHVGRPASLDGRIPLFVGLARALIGLCLAASGMSASWKKVLENRNLPPRKGLLPGCT